MKLIFSIVFLIPSFIFAQDELWRKYDEQTSGLCGRSIKLYSDSTYIYETGCEGRSHVNIGTWSLKENIITLLPVQFGKFKSFISISKKRKETSDSSQCIIILDKNDQPIPNFGLILNHSKPNYEKSCIEEEKYCFYSVPIKIKKHDFNFFVTTRYTDENGKIYLSWREKYLINKKGFTLQLSATEMFDENVVLKIKKYKNHNIFIKLNLHKDMFFYPTIKWLSLEQMSIKNVENKIIPIKIK